MLIGYMRVSSGDERQSVALQRDALLAAGVDQRHLHQDRASGARDDRPGLKACLAELCEGDVLVVWKLDRLGRSLSHLIRIVEDLKMRGVAFRSLTEAIDTTNSHGAFLFNLFGTLAEYERVLITERVNAGLAAARRRGRKGGRPPTIDTEKVEQILAALEAGASKASVCRTFKVPRSSSLRSARTCSPTCRRAWFCRQAQPGSTSRRRKPRARIEGTVPSRRDISCHCRHPCRPGVGHRTPGGCFKAEWILA